MKKFKKGEWCTTRKIANACDKDPAFNTEVLQSIIRYERRDWGELSENDKQANDNAVENEDSRIFAAYETKKGKIYIITEWDRSHTTILFANEY